MLHPSRAKRKHCPQASAAQPPDSLVLFPLFRRKRRLKMDNTSWTAPPGAAQPMGIQSTAGAVPIMNDKG